MSGLINFSVYDDSDLAELDDHYFWLWIVMITQNCPRCGIFKPNKRLLALRSRCPVEKVEAGLDELEKIGMIVQDKASGYVWIRNYIKHQSKQAQWRAAAMQELASHKHAPDLAAKALEYYSDINPDVRMISSRKQSDIKVISDQDQSDIKVISDQDQPIFRPDKDKYKDKDKKERMEVASQQGTKPKAKPRESIPSLSELEEQLQPEARPAWDAYKLEYQRDRGNRTVQESTYARILHREILPEISKLSLEWWRVDYALRAMARKPHPKPDNGRYFRAAASSDSAKPPGGLRLDLPEDPGMSMPADGGRV